MWKSDHDLACLINCMTMSCQVVNKVDVPSEFMHLVFACAVALELLGSFKELVYFSMYSSWSIYHGHQMEIGDLQKPMSNLKCPLSCFTHGDPGAAKGGPNQHLLARNRVKHMEPEELETVVQQTQEPTHHSQHGGWGAADLVRKLRKGGRGAGEGCPK